MHFLGKEETVGSIPADSTIHPRIVYGLITPV